MPSSDSGAGKRPRASGRVADAPPQLEMTFVTSAAGLDDSPPADRPEIAVAGRSNAGKSSVLNRLTGNRQTARVSKTPGRTRLLNFFDVVRIGGQPHHGRLVDLPGYGYARANRKEQARWQAAVNEFLSERDSLLAVVLVMDIRHPLQPYDVELIDWARASQLPLLALLNKADKLKHGARQQAVAKVRGRLLETPEACAEPFSATTGYNQETVLGVLGGWLANAEPA